jgi:hypothetical protein
MLPAMLMEITNRSHHSKLKFMYGQAVILTILSTITTVSAFSQNQWPTKEWLAVTPKQSV